MLVAGSVWIAFWGCIGLFIGLGWGVVWVFGPPYQLHRPGDLRALVFYEVIASVGVLPLLVGVSFVLGYTSTLKPGVGIVQGRARSVPLTVAVVATLVCLLAFGSVMRVLATWPSGDDGCCTTVSVPTP